MVLELRYVAAFAGRLNEFLSAKHSIIEGVYAKPRGLRMENDASATIFFQPEILPIHSPFHFGEVLV